MQSQYTRVGLIALLTMVISLFSFVVISPKAYSNNLEVLHIEQPEVQDNNISGKAQLLSKTATPQVEPLKNVEKAYGLQSEPTAHPFQYFVLTPPSPYVLQCDFQQAITTRVLHIQQVKRQMSYKLSETYRFSFNHEPESEPSLGFS